MGKRDVASWQLPAVCPGSPGYLSSPPHHPAPFPPTTILDGQVSGNRVTLGKGHLGQAPSLSGLLQQLLIHPSDAASVQAACAVTCGGAGTQG